MMNRVAGLTSQCDKIHSTVELHVCIFAGVFIQSPSLKKKVQMSCWIYDRTQ